MQSGALTAADTGQKRAGEDPREAGKEVVGCQDRCQGGMVETAVRFPWGRGVRVKPDA